MDLELAAARLEDRRRAADVLNRDLGGARRLASARGGGHRVALRARTHRLPGNERVDAIADVLAREQPVALYDGPLRGLRSGDLRSARGQRFRTQPRSAGGRRVEGPRLLVPSLVDGTPMRHATWAECEHRVKGRSGARFKKAISADDESAILRGWRVNPGSLSDGASVR